MTHIKALVTVVAAALIGAGSVSASTYHYFGLRLGTWQGNVSLLSVSTSGHAAAWFGINSAGNRSWVQAGVEQSSGDLTPSFYIERKARSGSITFRSWPCSLGDKAAVSIHHRGIYYWVVIRTSDSAAYRSRPVRITLGHVVDSVLELMGSGNATAHIGQRIVNGAAT